MLRGRSIYRDFFIRSSTLPACELDPSAFRDPAEWVSTIHLRCGEYNPLESTVDYVSHGMCDILEPAADTIEPVGQSTLLSHRQLLSEFPEWPRNSPLGQLSSPPRGYVSWARYILRAHGHTLREAGVYGAVYASLFSYESIPPSWVRGVIEFWDAGSNTCWVGPEQLGITLWDLRLVSGLPVYGRCYEEHIPPDEELFRRRPSADGSIRGEMILPAVLPGILAHYRSLYRRSRLSMRSRSALPADIWIRSFLQDTYLTQPSVLLHDPFDLGIQEGEELSKATVEPFVEIGHLSPVEPGIGEDLFLTGFLVTWLCTFVLPLRERSVRCSALLMASRISRGERISLAPVVLSRISRVMRIIGLSQPSEASE